MSEPTSPTSPISSVGSSFGSVASAASTMSAASTQKNIPVLNAKSPVVQAFARLFKDLSEHDKKFYLGRITKSIHDRVKDRLKENGKQTKESVMNTCFEKIFTDIWTTGDCGGLPSTDLPRFFNGFADFLRDFTFPPTLKDVNTLSLPMLEFVAILRYRASNVVDTCTFDMETVDWESFTDIGYEANASIASTIISEEVNTNSLLDFLTKNGIVNHGQHVRFNLGKIKKPTESETVRTLSELDPFHVNLSFRLNNNLIFLVIDKNQAVGESRHCTFTIDQVLTGGVVNRWTWSGKINNLKFYYKCESSPSIGGRKRRRSSKTKKVRARSTRRRHNIKKLKRSVYVKAGNTKRKIRRFRH